MRYGVSKDVRSQRHQGKLSTASLRTPLHSFTRVPCVRWCGASTTAVCGQLLGPACGRRQEICRLAVCWASEAGWPPHWGTHDVSCSRRWPVRAAALALLLPRRPTPKVRAPQVVGRSCWSTRERTSQPLGGLASGRRVPRSSTSRCCCPRPWAGPAVLSSCYSPQLQRPRCRTTTHPSAADATLMRNAMTIATSISSCQRAILAVRLCAAARQDECWWLRSACGTN